MESGQASIQVTDRSVLRYAEGRAERIAELFEQALGAAVRISLSAPTAKDASKPAKRLSERDAEQLPLVKQTMELFNARVVSVEKR